MTSDQKDAPDWTTNLYGLSVDLNDFWPSGDRNGRPFVPRCLSGPDPISFVSDTRVLLAVKGTYAAPPREGDFPADDNLRALFDFSEAKPVGKSTTSALRFFCHTDRETFKYGQIGECWYDLKIGKMLVRHMPEADLLLTQKSTKDGSPGAMIFAASDWWALWMPLEEKPPMIEKKLGVAQ